MRNWVAILGMCVYFNLVLLIGGLVSKCLFDLKKGRMSVTDWKSGRGEKAIAITFMAVLKQRICAEYSQ